MKASPCTGGYRKVNLCQNGTRKFKVIHRLVAKAFIPNPGNLPQINHLDGDKTNNSVENLVWCEALENVQHAVRIGLRNTAGENQANSKLTEKDVREIREIRCMGATYKEIASIYDVSETTAWDINNGRSWECVR